MALRDFIYIDKNRMYSLYSQLLEGVVESLVMSVSYSSEEQKTNKKLEETIIDASVKTQNVVLFDHIYNTLEEKLGDQLLLINESTTPEQIASNSIIKVTGYAVIEDYEHLSFLMQNFNDIGLALTTLTLRSANQDTNQMSKNSIDKYAKENGFYLDKKIAESINHIIDNFHGKSMEITIELGGNTLDVGFKALLDEKYLRLTTNSIRNLYGYKPCMKWTLVGEVTNISYKMNNRNEKNKSIFSDMFKYLNEIDTSFSKMDDSTYNIVRVAPIAVYIDRHQ